MGWASCGRDQYGREMGYAVLARCDEKYCNKRIDRGLAYVCGGMHEGGEFGCGGYFCAAHLYIPDRRPAQLCKRCLMRSGSGVGHWVRRSEAGTFESASAPDEEAMQDSPDSVPPQLAEFAARDYQRINRDAQAPPSAQEPATQEKPSDRCRRCAAGHPVYRFQNRPWNEHPPVGATCWTVCDASDLFVAPYPPTDPRSTEPPQEKP